MIDILNRLERVHAIAPSEHGTMQSANLGYSYHSLVWLFARADKMTLIVELPEPMRLVQIAQARGAVEELIDIRCDGRSIVTGSSVDLVKISEALRGGLKLRRGHAWEFDVPILRDGLLICTML